MKDSNKLIAKSHKTKYKIIEAVYRIAKTFVYNCIYFIKKE